MAISESVLYIFWQLLDEAGSEFLQFPLCDMKYSITESIRASMMIRIDWLNVMSSSSSIRQKNNSQSVLSSVFLLCATESIIYLVKTIAVWAFRAS